MTTLVQHAVGDVGGTCSKSTIKRQLQKSCLERHNLDKYSEQFQNRRIDVQLRGL